MSHATYPRFLHRNVITITWLCLFFSFFPCRTENNFVGDRFLYTIPVFTPTTNSKEKETLRAKLSEIVTQTQTVKTKQKRYNE